MSTNVVVCSLVAVLSFGSLIACTNEDPISSHPLTATPEAGVSNGERGDAITVKPTPDAGPTSDANADAAGQCKNAGAVFTPNSIKAPPPKNPSCLDGEIEQLADACFKDPMSPNCLAVRAYTSFCASCAFGSETDAQWKPIISGYPGVTGPYYNVAGCIDLLSNNSGCGQRFVRVIDCFHRYCDTCTGANETACQKDVALGSGECKAYLLDQQCRNVVLSEPVESKCLPPADDSDAARKAHFISLVTVACKQQ